MGIVADLKPLMQQHGEALWLLSQANIAEQVFGRSPHAMPVLSGLFCKRPRLAAMDALQAACAAAPGDWTATLKLADISRTLTVTQRRKVVAAGLDVIRAPAGL